MINQIYRSQVELLLRILPYVANEKDFALKGGTAINMFIWDMPRLSVDLDLTYVNVDHREIALSNISAALKRIQEQIINNTDIQVVTTEQDIGQAVKLVCKNTQVKIEANTIMRGIIKPITTMQVAPTVQKEFGLFAEMNIISYGELFGGKICAALDRQHPRDLFDIFCLLQKGGITEEIKQGFIMALLSHPRAIHEMLQPNLYNQREAFINQFSGMTDVPFTYEDFENSRKILVSRVQSMLTEKDKAFLVSFKSGTPEWQLSDIDSLRTLPAIAWKLLNIQKLKQNDPTKHRSLIGKLKDCLQKERNQ